MSKVLVALFHIFNVIFVDKIYLNPGFSCNKSLNKSTILLFAENNKSLKLILSTTSTS